MRVVKYLSHKEKRDDSITKTKFNRIKNLKLKITIKIKNKEIDKNILNLFNDEKKNQFTKIKKLKYNLDLTNDLTRKLIFLRKIF